MNHFKMRTTLLAAFMVCLAACNNNESSDSSPAVSASDSASGSSMSTTDTSKSTMTDTSMSKMNDTSMNKKSMTASSTTKKKKLKASIGDMSSEKKSTYTKDNGGVYDYSEVMPSFKGGSSAIEDYINNHIEFPQAASDDSKEGKVNVKFTVGEDGKVMNAQTVGPKLGDGLDEEAVNVVSSMPKWNPGTIKGKPVKVSMTLPIVFKAEE